MGTGHHPVSRLGNTEQLEKAIAAEGGGVALGGGMALASGALESVHMH